MAPIRHDYTSRLERCASPSGLTFSRNSREHHSVSCGLSAVIAGPTAKADERLEFAEAAKG